MLIRAITLCLALGLVSTALAKQKPLPMPLAQELPVEVVLNQQELAVEVPDNSGMATQFGLLGALIGSAIESAQVANAEKRVVDIRNLLIDYQFDKQFEKSIRAKLASEGLSPHPEIVVMPTPWDSVKASQANEQSRQGILVVAPRYIMWNTFETMRVRMTVMLVDRERKPNGKVKERVRLLKTYTENFSISHLPGSYADQDAERWKSLGKDQLSALLDEGIDQITDMLVYDFSPAGRAESERKVKREKASLSGLTYPGRELRSGKDWVWVRTGWSQYSVINSYHPISSQNSVPITPSAANSASGTAPGSFQ